MNVFIIIPSLCHGGAERVGVLLANGLYKIGHNVTVFTDLTEPVIYQVDESVQIIDFVGYKSNRFVKWYRAIKRIRKNIRSQRPDVLIGIMGLCTFATYLANLGMNTPIIMTEHNSFERPKSAPMPLYLRIFKFWINKLYKYITVLSEADKRAIGNKLKNVVVMPNPLLLRPVDKIPSKRKVLLAAGRLDSWHTKGFDVLIKAWGALMKNESLTSNSTSIGEGILNGWRLQIAGTGSEKSLDFLKLLCKENGVEDAVDFLGLQKDMGPIYNRSDIFVLSSRYEGFGLVLIEAMSQGCACIACDFKGRQREIIQDDSQGLCCEPDSVEALTVALKRMILDSTYRESVRFPAIERSKFYSMDNTIHRWDGLLRKVVRE